MNQRLNLVNSIWEKALVPKHPHVATSLETYAALPRQTARADKAAKMEARAKAIHGVRLPVGVAFLLLLTVRFENIATRRMKNERRLPQTARLAGRSP
jgi:hypothetical protein